jgi:hypothetical protein
MIYFRALLFRKVFAKRLRLKAMEVTEQQISAKQSK